ncbi:hypothetical protein Q5692_31905 [Microcoleus sp. C2C3]|uniref:hypothetical protein n=1 Tax=unclassified Microcoleus TaxID=2642155 RepID=UPI002FD3C898
MKNKIDPSNKIICSSRHPPVHQSKHSFELVDEWNPHLTAPFIPHYIASISVGIPVWLAKNENSSIVFLIFNFENLIPSKLGRPDYF